MTKENVEVKENKLVPYIMLKLLCAKSSITLMVDSFIHSAVCLMTGLKPLPKHVFHRVQSCASCLSL